MRIGTGATIFGGMSEDVDRKDTGGADLGSGSDKDKYEG